MSLCARSAIRSALMPCQCQSIAALLSAVPICWCSLASYMLNWFCIMHGHWDHTLALPAQPAVTQDRVRYLILSAAQFSLASCLALIRLLTIGGLDGLDTAHECHRTDCLISGCFGQLSGTQAKGKPRDTWQSTVYKDLSALHVQYSWFRSAHDQTGWRQFIASVRT